MPRVELEMDALARLRLEARRDGDDLSARIRRLIDKAHSKKRKQENDCGSNHDPRAADPGVTGYQLFDCHSQVHVCAGMAVEGEELNDSEYAPEDPQDHQDDGDDIRI